MSRNILIAATIILLLIIGIWFLNRSSKMPQSETTQTEFSPSLATEGGMVSEENMVVISAAGFSPMNIVIKQGDSVTWENKDSANHTINSDPHPTHSLYPFLNASLLKSGDKKTIIFEKAGKYSYHDHLNPSLTGTVTVE